MIKKFESFKNVSSDIDESEFEYCYPKIITLINDSYPAPDHLTYKYLDDKFFDMDQLVIPLEEVDTEITTEDKKNVIKLYTELYNQYDLGSFPDLEDIHIIFEDIMKSSPHSHFVILLNDKKIKFYIHLASDIKYYPKDTDIKFDWNKFNDLSSETNVAINRLKDYGYKVETYINGYFHIRIDISN